MFRFWRRRKRRRLKKQPFPDAWCEIIRRRVPYYALLTNAEREQLHGHILVLLAEKEFVGVDGVEITDDIRVTVAAQAALLLLNRDTDYFPDLYSIVIYPHEFAAPTTERLEDGTVLESYQTRIGESWDRGQLVLSWRDVVLGAADDADGTNVVLHEFAHQLDSEVGATDGAPNLPRAQQHEWARVFTERYRQLIADLNAGRSTCLNPYAAKNPAEFFAVSTESFFEQPVRLRSCHPDLYERLQLFYRQDPATRWEPHRPTTEGLA